MKKYSALLAWAVWAAVCSAQDEAAPGPTPPPELSAEDRLEALDAAQLQSAIDTLRQRHLESDGLDETALRRATLRGLLTGFAPGAELAGDEAVAAPDAPFRSEVLDERTGYVRLGALRTENLAQLDAALQEFREEKIPSIIIDLRATPPSRDFNLAAQMAGRFTAKDTLLFTLGDPEAGGQTFPAAGSAGFRGVLAVVVDGDTTGAVEVLAATLRQHARAMVVGAPTAGRAVEFGEVDLGDGHRLRFAVAEARVTGAPAIYPHGLQPDVAVAQDRETRDELLAAALEKGAAPYVFEAERAQMNEAALVAGTNPEISGDENATSGLLDLPLQRALDLVTAIRLFHKQE
jgi:hypothetical protein